MLLIATITADMHGCCWCIVDSASTELLLSCFGSLYDFGWFASWCLCSFNNILSIGKTVLIAGFQALIWILEAFLNRGHKQDCNRHQSDLAVEVRAACRPADAAVLSVADDKGRANNLRFALSIKISLKGVLKPSATCTSLVSYITNQPQWAERGSARLCVCKKCGTHMTQMV